MKIVLFGGPCDGEVMDVNSDLMRVKVPGEAGTIHEYARTVANVSIDRMLGYKPRFIYDRTYKI